MANPTKTVAGAARATLADLMNLQDTTALVCVSNIASINGFEVCHIKDVVLLKSIGGNGFIAGDVWMRTAVSRQTYSVVSWWSLQTLNTNHRCARWLKYGITAVVKCMYNHLQCYMGKSGSQCCCGIVDNPVDMMGECWTTISQC